MVAGGGKQQVVIHNVGEQKSIRWVWLFRKVEATIQKKTKFHNHFFTKWVFFRCFLAIFTGTAIRRYCYVFPRFSSFTTHRFTSPFKSQDGLVQSVAFHPTRPHLYVARQSNIAVYDLQKLALIKTLQPAGQTISSMAIHPSTEVEWLKKLTTRNLKNSSLLFKNCHSTLFSLATTFFRLRTTIGPHGSTWTWTWNLTKWWRTSRRPELRRSTLPTTLYLLLGLTVERLLCGMQPCFQI